MLGRVHPQWSAHSGITTWREARSALSSRMPTPSVRNTPACDTATFRSVGSGVLWPPSGAGGTTKSGMVTARTAAAAIPTTPTQ